ncbi:MAG: hypothetical protein ABJG88_12300 [Litorimonas sp.]
MAVALSLLIIFAITFFVVRLASVALKLTGLSEQNSRFQALSALTGTGFTTAEAEMVVNYPIRRKIISMLMIFGNLGVVSVLSTVMISFVRTDASVSAILLQLAWMFGVTIVFFGVMLTQFVDRVMCGLIRVVLEKFTFLGGRHYRKLLQLGGGLSLGEHQFFVNEDVTPSKLKADLEQFSILAVRRSSGLTEAFSLDIDTITPGDSLILFGPDGLHDGLKTS